MKGFIYTLEAVIAATLFLGVTVAVIPEIQDRPARTDAAQTAVHSSLESLDRSGDLRDNLTREAIKADVDGFIPAGFNHSVGITKMETETRYVDSPPDEYFFNKSGDHAEVQLWIENANGLNVTFDGEKIVEEYSSSGYELRTVSGTKGFLNFTGTGELHFDFDVYETDEDSITDDGVRNVNYVVVEKGTRQIQVKIWRE